ncbi:MAG: hypothetical protein JNN12_11645 [Bacteroidetes Order II. Incertae sedis bacterium]|nr:hypothetical protein [Bacteroidetes Order II. bacterium]
MLHEIILELRHLDVSRKALQKFGWLIGGILTISASWFLFRSHSVHTGFWYIILGGGVFLLFAGTFFSTSLSFLYRIWMGLAFVMGAFMSRIILTLVFFLLVTPIGVIMRLFRKDLLDIKPLENAATFWIPKTDHDPSPARLEKYF